MVERQTEYRDSAPGSNSHSDDREWEAQTLPGAKPAAPQVVVYGDSLVNPLTGLGTYTLHLLENLVPLVGESNIKVLRFGKLLPPSFALIQFGRASSGSSKPASGSPVVGRVAAQIREGLAMLPGVLTLYRWLLNQISAVKLRRYSSQDVLLCPNFLMLKFPGKRIATIGDLSTFRYPEHHPASRVSFVNRSIANAVMEADHLLTFSNHVRSEILERFDVRPERLSVTYLGADSDFRARTEDELADTLRPLSLDYKRYLISNCTLEPRKNLDRFLDAYECYRSEVSPGSGLPLLLVGHHGWKNDALLSRIKRLSQGDGVRYLGYVDSARLPLLIAGARASVYMSLYEGFGLPVLEALRCRTLVLTSQGTSMAEFASPPALLADPLSVRDMADKLHIIHSKDQSEARYQSERPCAPSATWQDCARKTYSVLLRVSQEAA